MLQYQLTFLERAYVHGVCIIPADLLYNTYAHASPAMK